ncbi:MAG: hypothetical protein QGG33_00910 [Candidatus Krumholzibacteria bacterium]|nr:hypothetical protein [Candidatus Krumholzibacteria bacterium]
MSEIGIAGIASYLPQGVSDNAALVARHGFDADFISDKLGIETRHHAGPHETTADLATRAAEAMLEKAGIPELPLHCNDLGFLEDGRWKVLPAESPRIRGLCNHCKSWWLQESRLPLIYIGDGTTDRCPAERADLLFAKGGLARWCEEEGLEHVPFETFDDILLWLDSLAGETWLDTLTAP